MDSRGLDPLNQSGACPEEMELELAVELVEQMRRHVIESAPFEACGLVAGQAGCAQAVYPITNELHSPVRFRMDPREQLAAFEQIEEHGWELLAIYHSHPDGPSAPSQTDVAEAYYPEALQLIWRRQTEGWRLRAFTIQQDQVREISMLYRDA